MRPGPILHGAALAASLGGCATVGRPDLSTERCADDFARQLGDVIYSRGSSLRSFFLAAERDDVRRRNEGGG